MERMKDLEEMLRELSEKYKNSKSVEVYEEDLEGWFKIIDDLREENKNLKEKIELLDNENMCLNAEIKDREEENKKLKEELGEYKKMFEDKLKDGYIKNTAEFMDKKFPKVNGFMEEDTLQELKDIGEL